MGSILSSLIAIGLAYMETANLAQVKKPDIPWWFWVVMGSALVILVWMLFNRPAEEEGEKIEEKKFEPIVLPELEEKSPQEEAFDFTEEEDETGLPVEEQFTEEEKAAPSPFLDVYEEELEETPAFEGYKLTKDDLTMIEGISAKTAKILSQADIHTFEQLANTDVEKLQVVLAASGIFLTDPSSWPVQARMAADDLWDDLRQYQNELKKR